MDSKIIELENEISKIKQRNKAVELDKSWETSLARKIVILVLTYIVASLVFYFSGSSQPLVDSLVPTVAFFLSTLSLGVFKKIWLKYH